MAFTFRGGVHVEESKNTAACAIRVMPAPSRVSIPLSQHIGAPAVPVVKKGDKVLSGQMIASAADKALSVAIHSPVNGTVTEVNKSKITISV